MRGTVRTATAGDIPMVATLHARAIGEGFLSTLGPRFLRHLYARIASSEHGLLLVAVDSEGPAPAASGPSGSPVIGFVAGTSSVGRLYREFVWRDGLAVCASSGLRLVRAMPRVLETLRYGTTGSHPADETELLSLAVDERARHRGIGTALVEAFRHKCVASGATSARVVVAAANVTAISVYTRAGFTEAGRFELHSGSPSVLLRADVTRVAP